MHIRNLYKTEKILLNKNILKSVSENTSVEANTLMLKLMTRTKMHAVYIPPSNLKVIKMMGSDSHC